ncbi:glycerol-3-phosphate transporter subunit; ATP-binding component of ABC superfamily [uncultured delta proteobacterium]|uniref:Glycerol-3-phosphate transporter subunit ATP-binding component of ABC superfamily n=1 Tax=uncultured delta proteobacterium TaxID=34034 RepID=A0A212K673_9DELT|nr:glycerol-3-phosphate transporter subunit; ATP-binding component of ABC superfamily [uncultured delta proteobacterium]
MAQVELKHVEKRFGGNQVIKDLSLVVPDGTFLVIVGPSGCGKSTVLRLIAGLEQLSGGEIHINGKDVAALEPKDRNVAMVFQNYALYPHMNVRENMCYGLKVRKVPKEEQDARVNKAADLLGLAEYLDRTPRQLSGGQRQRVAMGRAIVRDPAVFLFDEPLSNLDASLRNQMRVELRRLHERLGTTSIYVTHDQVEAMTLAKRILVMNKGAMEQYGTPDDLYLRPASVFVARFIGSPNMNMLRCRVTDGVPALGDGTAMPGAVATDITPGPGTRDALLGIRPEDFRLAESGGEGVLRCTAELTEALGADTLVHCAVGQGKDVMESEYGPLLIVRLEGSVRPQPGETLFLAVRPGRAHLFDMATHKRMTGAAEA